MGTSTSVDATNALVVKMFNDGGQSINIKSNSWSNESIHFLSLVSLAFLVSSIISFSAMISFMLPGTI
ncbi:hypothetical protein D3C81_1877360 [compost metagenome]